MCRLFGLYANKPVSVGFSFYESPRGSFEELSYRNPSGWGIAWLDEEGWHIYKEPHLLYKSREAREYIETRVFGRIIVSHVRLASVGNESLENTHPWLYHGWVFAHNGTISRRPLLELIHEEYKRLRGNN